MDGVIELVELLRDLPAIRSAALDAAQLGGLPAALVQLSTLDQPTLDQSIMLGCRVSLIVSDTGSSRDAQVLVDLYADVVPAVLTPDGPVTFAAVELPGRGLHPALIIPVDVHATTTTERNDA